MYVLHSLVMALLTTHSGSHKVAIPVHSVEARVSKKSRSQRLNKTLHLLLHDDTLTTRSQQELRPSLAPDLLRGLSRVTQSDGDSIHVEGRACPSFISLGHSMKFQLRFTATVV